MTGRHRDGSPRAVVHRRRYDGAARAEAARLDRSWRGWLVLYSLGRRRFYAIAAWPVSLALTVDDDTAGGLETRMREEEMTMLRNGTFASPPSGSLLA